MENRFGLKDLILYAAIVGLVILILLGMAQDDRQIDRLNEISARLNEQGSELRELRRAIRSGGVAVGTPADAEDSVESLPAFAEIVAAQNSEGYAAGDWVVNAFGGGVAKLTPLVSGDAAASDVQAYILESLAARNHKLEWHGLIATRWEIEDNTAAYFAFIAEHPESAPVADATEPEAQATTQPTTDEAAADPEAVIAPEPPAPVLITFYLRDDVRFSDGTPLTADDIVFTFDFIMNEAIDASRMRAYYRKIRRVEKIDDHTVRFVYNEPYFNAFELAAGFDVLPKHFYGKFSPADFNKSVGLLMGSGPYRLENPESWRPGLPIRLVRNNRYWGVAPTFDRLLFREITNDVARLTAFRNGEIDIFGAQPEQYRDMLADEALKARSQHYEYQSISGGYRYIAWNQLREGKPTPFADKRVRQAMTMLTDRTRLINEVMLGYAVEATGPFNPNSKQYNNDVVSWPYDVKRATELLAEAGWQDRNRDGVLENEAGERFVFKLTYPSGNANYEKMVLLLQDSYARAGVVLEPDPLEWSVFTQRLGNKDFQAISLGWTSGVESDIYQMFHSYQTLAGGDNFISYKSDALDAIIEQARKSIAEDVRMPLWQQAHAILHEDQPYTFLFFGKSLRFLDKRFQNVLLNNIGMNTPLEWYVPADRQRWTQQ